MKYSWQIIFSAGILVIMQSSAFAKGVSSTAGATLLDAPSARASALGEALNGWSGDIDSAAYNPSQLQGLRESQASLSHYRGLAEDTKSQIMVGIPRKTTSLGLMFSYYNAGKVESFDGTATRSVTAKEDYILGLGWGFNLNNIKTGVMAKYFSSTLAEEAKATAYAVDLGMSGNLAPRLGWGVAIQNLGSTVTYLDQPQKLPTVMRAGMAWKIPARRLQSTLLMDVPYYINEERAQWSVGYQVGINPLAFRVGYKSGNSNNGLSFGTGFMIRETSIDYSFGMNKELDSTHRFSMSQRFGGKKTSEQQVNNTLSPSTALVLGGTPQ